MTTPFTGKYDWAQMVASGVQAVRNGGPASIRQAEAYQQVFPQVSGVLA